MATYLRHVGRVINTDQPVIVVYMQLPDAPERSLCVQMSSLPDRYVQVMRSLLESDEGQHCETFGDLLGRRIMPDTGLSVLQTLHEQRLLFPVSIDNLLMQPYPSKTIPMREVLTMMGRLGPNQNNNFNDILTAAASADMNQAPVSTPAEAAANHADQLEPFNPFAVQQKADAAEHAAMMAQNYLAQASLLQSDADALRAKAYDLVPSLRPTAKAIDEISRQATATIKQRANEAGVTKAPAKRPAASKGAATSKTKTAPTRKKVVK